MSLFVVILVLISIEHTSGTRSSIYLYYTYLCGRDNQRHRKKNVEMTNRMQLYRGSLHALPQVYICHSRMTFLSYNI